MLSQVQEEIWDCLSKLDGETVARLFTDYYGNQLMDDDFREYLVENEYLDDKEN